ncbi:MAG: hypothetical protein K2G24_00815 [Muribaculaceae bacterium]|nr:hypothetical protein [Muribaculaceae bacterium]
MKRLFLIISLLSVIPICSTAQIQYEHVFYSLVDSKKHKDAEHVLRTWEKYSPQDPELPVARFRLHVEKARKVSLSRPDRYGKRKAEQSWNKKELAKAMDAIDCGIAAYPARFDFYVMKAENQMTTADYTGAGNTLTSMLSTGRDISYQWRIARSAQVSDSINATISTLEPFIRNLFDAHTPESIDALEKVVTEARKDFPDDSRIIHAAGKAALAENKPGIALRCFDTANRLDSGNPEYIIDMAYACFLTNQDSLAVDYYRKVLKMNGTTNEQRNRAYYMSRMMTEAPRELTLKQFEFTALPWLAWNFAPGSSELFLSNAEFILNKYLKKMGYDVCFDTEGITAELVNVDGMVCVAWTFPIPKELGLLGYLVMVPNGPKYDVFALARFDRDRTFGENTQHLDYWEVYHIQENGMTAYARIPRPQRVATFARQIATGVLR